MSKKVIMKATIEVTKPKNHKDYFIGGFNFIIDGNEIPFDFDATGYNINKNDDNDIISYQSGYGMLFDDFDIAGYYDNDYKQAGLTDEDITAEFLSGVEEIREFYFYPDNYTGPFYFQIINIDFYDEAETKFSVSKEILDKFNSNIKEDITIDIVYSDDFDGDLLYEENINNI